MIYNHVQTASFSSAEIIIIFFYDISFSFSTRLSIIASDFSSRYIQYGFFSRVFTMDSLTTQIFCSEVYIVPCSTSSFFFFFFFSFASRHFLVCNFHNFDEQRILYYICSLSGSEKTSYSFSETIYSFFSLLLSF